jgi:hypothetical protein
MLIKSRIISNVPLLTLTKCLRVQDNMFWTAVYSMTYNGMKISGNIPIMGTLNTKTITIKCPKNKRRIKISFGMG